MRGVKLAALISFVVLTLGLVSAYGGLYGFNVGLFLAGMSDYLPMIIVFFVTFYFSNLILSKALSRGSWIIALIIAIFSVYGLYQMNVDYVSLFYKLGMGPDFLFHVGPWIIIAFLAITIWTGNLGRLSILVGIIFVLLGATEMTEQKSLSITVGIILVLVGIKTHHWIKLRRGMRQMSPKDKVLYKNLRSQRRDYQAQKWNAAGRKIGRGIGKVGKGIGKIVPKKQKP